MFSGVVSICESKGVILQTVFPPHWDYLCCVKTSHVLVEDNRCSKKSLSFLQNYMSVVIFKMGNKILVSFPFCNLYVNFSTSSLNYLHCWKACVTTEGCSQIRSERESCCHCSDSWRSVILLFLALSQSKLFWLALFRYGQITLQNAISGEYLTFVLLYHSQV